MKTFSAGNILETSPHSFASLADMRLPVKQSSIVIDLPAVRAHL